MAQVRYGARSADARRNRELEASKGEIWSQALTAIYETDPEVIAVSACDQISPLLASSSRLRRASAERAPYRTCAMSPPRVPPGTGCVTPLQ